jgi:hypothetical protein
MGDADITLRQITRRRPEELVRPFVRRGCRVRVVGWIDTQLTCVERRIDKALRVHVDRELRALHVEFFIRLRPDVPERMFDYRGHLKDALRAEAPGEPVPRIESVAVVLSGRRRRLPRWGRYATAWPGSRFSGCHFRIDAVYQLTVAELRARGSLLWLVLTPLARDATVGRLRRVVKAIRMGARDDEERRDLYVALIVMAKIDPWGHNLQAEIAHMIDMTEASPEERELIQSAMRDLLEARYFRLGREEAIQELLGRLFARRVGRGPSTAEREAMLARARKLGAEKVEDAMLDREGEALVRWLLEPGGKRTVGRKTARRGKR